METKSARSHEQGYYYFLSSVKLLYPTSSSTTTQKEPIDRKNSVFTSYLNQLTSETDPPCFTKTALPEYSHTPSANKLHSHSSTSDAYAATNPALDSSPSLLSPQEPYLSTPFDSYSSSSPFQTQSDTFYFPPLSSSFQIPLSTESSKSAPSSSDTDTPSSAKAFYFPVFSSDENP